MSVAQTKQPNIENKNRYYNQGRSDGDEEEEDEINMYAHGYQNESDIQNNQAELDEQDLHHQLPKNDQIINQIQQNNEEYDQENENEQQYYNQFHQLQHVFKHDQDNHGGLEKQWFYSFQENSEDNENIQQISQIPSSQFQSQQLSIQSSQQKIPSYINQQQQIQQKQGYSQNQQQSKNQQFQLISSKQLSQNVMNNQESLIQSQQENYDDKEQEGDEQNQFKQMEILHMMQGNQNNQQFINNQKIKADQKRQNNSQNDQEIHQEEEGEFRQQEDEQLEQQIQSQQQQQQPVQGSQEDMIMCNKCQNFPFNYIELNCQHSFCLQCMAEWFIQQDYLTIDQIFELPISSTDENYSELKEECMINVQCMLCLEQTLLDYDSVEAVKEVIRQIQINFIQQQENQKLADQNQEFGVQGQEQIYQNQHDQEQKSNQEEDDDQYFQNQLEYQGQQYVAEDQFHLKGFSNKQNNTEQLIAQQNKNFANNQYNSCDENDEYIDESQLNYQNQLVNNKNQPHNKQNPLVNINEYQKQMSDSSSSSSQGFALNQPQISNINLQKLQPVIQPSQQSPVLVIQNDSQINSLQARQEIIYEDSSETFQTEETNRNHNNNNNHNQINLSKEDIKLGKKQFESAQQTQNQTAESKSSSSQQDYQNQNYMKEEQKKSHGKEFNKFINTSNKNYHYVNSQQSFSNNNSPNNNTTPYDTNSMQIFSKKNQDYTSFSNSQFNASMTPQSNTDINFGNKEQQQQQIIQNHAMPFNEYFSMPDKQQNHLISPNNIQQQQQFQQFSQQSASLQNQQGELTQSNYSGASTSHNHESSTMSDVQKKIMNKGGLNDNKQLSDNQKKMQVKSTPVQFQSSERNTEAQQNQLEDVEEHYGEQTDDEAEGSAFKYPQKLNFSKIQQKNPDNVQQQGEFSNTNQQSENIKKELNYDDFANVSDSNLQDEESFQHQQTNVISNNPSLRESQKLQQEKSNRVSQQQEQDKKFKQTDNQNVNSASFNQFAQQIQKIQQKDQIKNIAIPSQNKAQGFDQKFISRDLKNQQQQQQEERFQREQLEQERDNVDDITYDLRANEDESQYLDPQEAFSNQLYNQIKIEQKQNLEQKIQKLNSEQLQKQQQQTQVAQKQYNNFPATSSIEGDQFQLLAQQQKNSTDKFEKNSSSVRPLQNVNQYEPPEDNSNKKKPNSQKFIISNINQSNFSTNTNFTSNYNNNLTNQQIITGSNFITVQQNQEHLNSNNNQSTIESQKYKIPQNSNYQQSFNSSINEEKLNPMQSVFTVERSIDTNQQKNPKRNSYKQNNPDEDSQFQQSQDLQIAQNEKQAKAIQKQQIEPVNRKGSNEIRGNQINNYASVNSKTSAQDNNLSLQTKKKGSQNDQMSLDISNSMNEMSSHAEYFDKKQPKQDMYFSSDSQNIQGYNKYDLPLKQQSIIQNEQEVINNQSVANNQKRDPSPQISQQKQGYQKVTSQSGNNQKSQIQSQQENEESLKRSIKNKIVDNKQKQQQQQQQLQQQQQEVINVQENSSEQEIYQQNDYAANEEDCENIQFKLQPYCDEHPYEELGFFNFSQNKCICLKCLQKGEFVTEDVTNFEKGQELLLEKVDDCSRQINVCFELIKLSQKREEEKHRKRVEKANQAKMLITEQIQLLIQKLEEKQSQLTVEAEEVLKISENILTTKQEELQHKLKILSQLRFHFSEINARNIQPNAKTFKEFQFCRNILDQFLFENEDILQLANHNNANNSPNGSASKNQASSFNNQFFLQQSQQDIIINNFKMDEISNFIDQIQFLKNKICDLRGVELGTHNSSLRNSFANNVNSKNQQQITNNNNLNVNNTSSKMNNQNIQNVAVSNVHSFLNEEPQIQNNQQAHKEPKPYYKSSDKSTRRQSSSQKQQIMQQQQQQHSYQQQEQSGNNFSPNQQIQQIADSYQMNHPNAFEPDDQTINLNQLFQQQILQQQQMQQMQHQMNNQVPNNPIKKNFNDQIQYVIGSNPFDKDRIKDTNSTFSSQNLTYINNNNNSLNFANPLSQKLYAQFLTNVNSPVNQQQILSSQSFSNQNLIKSQSQKNLYEQQQHSGQYPNQLLQEFQQKNNPFSPNVISSNYPTLINNNEFKERKQQKTDPGNIAAAHNGAFRQFQNNSNSSTKANQQHLMQFNQILNSHLGSGTLNNNNNSNSNLLMMNNHGISLLDGGISHHLGSTTEASKNIQLIDDQFTSFKNNLAEEFNNSIENHSLKRPSFPTTSANKSSQQTIDLFRKTNSVSNIISQNTHQSPSRYALLKGNGNTNKIASTVNSTLPKSSEYYNKSSFISNYYNGKLDKGSFSNTNANSNNNSGINIKSGNYQNSYSHRIQSTDPLSAIAGMGNNSIIAKKRQSQILRTHFTNNQNTSQGNINNYSSELKNSFCETGSINNSGNRYTTKKSEIGFVNNNSTTHSNTLQNNYPLQIFNVPHNTSFSKSKQASHGNLHSFYNNNNNNISINNNINSNNNINTLHSDFNQNISFQGTSGKSYNIKNQNTFDSKNSGIIYKSLKKYQDLFRRQKKIMFENEIS